MRCQFCAERGYPSSIVSSALGHARNIDKETVLKPSKPNTEQKIPFTSTYYPNNLSVKIILSYFRQTLKLSQFC